MIIDTSALNALLLEAFKGNITWLEASKKFTLDDYIDTFYRTRETMAKTISELTDAQVAYLIPGDPMWSISEMVTHLVYTQNGYYNFLLDISAKTDIPHMAEAARGFGEGAQKEVPAEILRKSLSEATERMKNVIQLTRNNHDPEGIHDSKLFGNVNYTTWILLLLGHETDHVRQGIIMRRAARNAVPKRST
jgi:hypothetical protein